MKHSTTGQRPVRTFAATTLTAILVTTSVLAVTSSEAEAIATGIRISGTGGDGVRLRSAPNTSSGSLAIIPEGASPDIHCFTYGTMVGNVNVWFKATYAGKTGFFASYYDNSSYRNEAELTAKYKVPKCGAAAPAPAPPPSNGPTRPTGEVGLANRGTFKPPRPRQAISSSAAVVAARASFNSYIAVLDRANHHNAESLARHYLSAAGSERGFPIGDLIWHERPLWGAMEWQLRHNAMAAYKSVASSSSDKAALASFTSGWVPYSAGCCDDWYWSLHSFSFAVRGDVWIGPRNASGFRQVQVRYRAAIYDKYDFNSEPRGARLLADKGQAAEFVVSQHTRTVYSSTTDASAQAKIGSMPFEW